MKQLFHITNQQHTEEQKDVLIMEVGEDYSGIAKCNGSSKVIQEITYYTFQRFEVESVAAIWEEAKAAGDVFEKVIVASAFPQAILVPNKFVDEETDRTLLQAVYPVAHDLILHDDIRSLQLFNVYAVPKTLHRINTSHFPNVEYLHIYTASLKTETDATAGTSVFVQFATSSFRVKVKKDQKLMLVQTFSFQTPLDVVYVLLKISAEMSLNQEETPVILSGFIEENSDIYKELYNYFLHLRFLTLPDRLPENPYPSHFFASLYNLAACVL